VPSGICMTQGKGRSIRQIEALPKKQSPRNRPQLPGRRPSSYVHICETRSSEFIADVLYDWLFCGGFFLFKTTGSGRLWKAVAENYEINHLPPASAGSYVKPSFKSPESFFLRVVLESDCDCFGFPLILLEM